MGNINPLILTEEEDEVMIKGFIKLINKAHFFLIKVLVTLWRTINVWGASCRFYPSCSEYALLCARMYPAHKAIVKIIWRVIRCNPLSRGGVDFP